MTEWLQSKIYELLLGAIWGAATLVIGLFWREWLLPRLQDPFFTGTRLAPRYQGEFLLDGTEVSEIVELNQRAYKVWGRITSPGTQQKIHEFEGTLKDNVLRATYDGAVMATPVRGSFLLVVPPGAGSKKLQGSFAQPTEKGPVSKDYKWIPIPNV